MKPRVLVLYEHGLDGLPYSSSYLRLLRPLSYPGVDESFHITFAPVYTGNTDMLIVDRLWHSDVTLAQVEGLVDTARSAHMRLLYAVDDNFFELPPTHASGLPSDYREIVRFLIKESDAVLTTTSVLAEYLKELNSRTLVVNHALDERLIGAMDDLASPAPTGAVVLGYMGTPTHDEDLQSILPALTTVAESASFPLVLEIIGGCAHHDTRTALQRLPLPVRWLEPPNPVYPSFVAWFQRQIRWDIALAPLVNTPFNRAKSDIKFLDYSAIGAAGIYSRDPVYGRSVRHGVTGWLADATVKSWEEALSTLIGNAALRMELAANARRQLYDERILAHRSPDWIAALETIWYG